MENGASELEAELLGLHGCLQERLEAVFRSVEHKRVVTIYRAGGRTSSAGVASEPGSHVDPGEWTFPTGCLTKLFTGALIGRTIRDGGVRLEDRVAAIFSNVAQAKALFDTTINDLLNHTHGLDDGALANAPVDGDGFIDVEALLVALVPRRFAEPGEIYSYSNAGAWISAAILERVHGRPFEAQLRTDLFEPLGVRICMHAAHPAHSSLICPAMGAALAMSARDMLAFLESEVLERPDAWLAAVSPGAIRPLSGWNAAERGVFRGWKYHGENWFGHGSIWPNASAMVRVQPRIGVAIVVASTSHPAPLAASRVFANLLPEYKRLSLPQPLTADAAERLDLQSYCGCYCSATEALVVRADAGQVRFSAPGIDAALIPAASETFFLRPPAPGRFTFVQFLEREGRGFRYAWDGVRVYRRLE